MQLKSIIFGCQGMHVNFESPKTSSFLKLAICNKQAMCLLIMLEKLFEQKGCLCLHKKY